MEAAPRFLLVDDDGLFRALARRFLSMNCPDVDVIECGDGIDALEFLVRNRVDLIITDFRMPFVNGLRLTAAVRAADRNVPIVLISGEDISQEALEQGANAFIQKSALVGQLARVLSRLGFKTRRERALAAAPAA